MVKRILTAGLFLFAASALAQPTPFRVPPKYTVATAPACVDGEPKIYAVTDAASSASCAVAGGTTEVVCQCLDGTVSVVGSGSGGSSNSFETINAPAGTDPVADSATDTLNVTCSGGLTCTGTAATDTLDFTMGTASAATALAANGANCSAGNYPLGVDASGAAESCTAVPADTDDQAATEVPYTPTTGTDWSDPDPTHAGGGLDALAARLTTEEGKADDDVPESGDFGAAADLEADGTLSADVVAAAEMADADHGDVSWSGGVAAVDSGAVGLTEIADDATCTGGQATRRNAGDTAFECYTPAAGGIGGSTGATDEGLLRADGTGGSTVQASSVVTLTDSGILRFGGTDNTAPALVKNGAALWVVGAADPTTAWADFKANNIYAALISNADAFYATGGGLAMNSTGAVFFSNNSSVPGTPDISLTRNAAGVLRIANGSTGIGALLNSKLVEANTAGSGAPNAIAATESGTVYTNEGATAKAYQTLPTAVAGYKFTFIVMDTDGLRVTAAAGDDLRIGVTTSTTAGYCESTTIGDSVTFVSVNAVTYVATSLVGSGWTCG